MTGTSGAQRGWILPPARPAAAGGLAGAQRAALRVPPPRCRARSLAPCPAPAAEAPLGGPSATDPAVPMASGHEVGAEPPGSPGAVAARYHELSRFPSVTYAAVGAAAGDGTFPLYTECSQPDPQRRRLLHFSRRYSVRLAPTGALSVERAALSTEIHHELLGQVSPSGHLRAALTRCPGQGHEWLEVWGSGGRCCSVDLTALGKHGEVYTEAPFACLAWSHAETRLLYVAEKRRPLCSGGAPGAAGSVEEEEEEEEGERFVYRDDWGEALSGRSAPVLCALHVEEGSVAVLEGIPRDVSPGQALWSPEDSGIIFVGWWHRPFRLGLSACSNRRSALFHLDLASGRCELLSAEQRAVRSPRLSPDGRRLLYLEGAAGGPHRQCLQLRALAWRSRRTAMVLDVVQEAAGGAFAGIYAAALPPRCWAADGRRALLSTPQRSRTDLLLVDTETGTVTNLTAGSTQGCWELLTVQRDLLVATCSAPNQPPCLVVGLLPPAGQEPTLQWVPAEDMAPVPGVSWKTLTLQPPHEEQSPPAQGAQPFEALLLSPLPGAAPHPLLVWPHGGPHAVFDARWRPAAAALCQLGFAVLMVNYRGSLGFGQAALASLLARQGEQDVADTQLAAEQALRDKRLDRRRVALLGASHGAFVALHLLARHPELYRVCAVRSPVTDLATLLGTSDIPDWRYTALRLPYSFERVPRAEDLAAMLLRSPIAQAHRVRAPVLLCVGARDRRVSPTQALEFYRVLRARGVPARLLWYPEGNHALSGVETEADVFTNCALWIIRHLGLPCQAAPDQHGP